MTSERPTSPASESQQSSGRGAPSARSDRAAGGEVWTTRRLLAWMGPYFESRGLDAPRLVAEMLLAHVLDCDRMRLYMEADRPAAAEELATLRALVARAAKHEPVQYLIGQARFYGRDFAVTPHVFIPQPCTEEIVSVVSEWFGRGGRTSVDGEEPANDGGADAGPLFADVGTGSGCLAVSLALQVPRARVVATDADEAALEVARGNAERFGVTDRLAFVIGSLLEPVRAWMDEGGDAPDGAASGAGAGPFPRAGGRFDVICSNPPYIPDHEWEGGQVQEAVRKYVPQRALRGGRDGLDFIRPLIAGAGSVLKSGGRLVIEIADCQRDAVLDLVEKAPGLGNAEVRRDHEGLWRIFVAERVRSA